MGSPWAPGAGLQDRQALSFMSLAGKDTITVSRQRDNRTRIAAPICKPPGAVDHALPPRSPSILAGLIRQRFSWKGLYMFVAGGCRPLGLRAAAIHCVVRIAGLLLDECERVVPLLRSPVLSDRWAQPSALEQWSNGGLAGHLARSAFNLERAVGQPRSGTPARDAVTYYAASPAEPPGSLIGRRIRELGDQEAAGGAAVLADRFAASVARLRESALALDACATVEMFGQVLPIGECATACLLELVVHADDLTVSLDFEPVAFSEPAIDLVVVTLSRISRRRHGNLAVIRALSRPERSPAQGIRVF